MNKTVKSLILGIIMLVGGIALIIMMIKGMIDNSQPPVGFDSLTGDNIKSGMLVEGDIPYNFGNYETRYSESDSGYKKTLGKYYLIQLQDGKFMGAYTSSQELMTEFNYQSDEYYDYLTGKTDKAPRTVHVKGYIKSMDIEDKRILMNYATEVFGMEAVSGKLTGYYIENIDDGALLPIFLGGGVIMMIVGVGFILMFIRGRAVKR